MFSFEILPSTTKIEKFPFIFGLYLSVQDKNKGTKRKGNISFFSLVMITLCKGLDRVLSKVR